MKKKAAYILITDYTKQKEKRSFEATVRSEPRLKLGVHITCLFNASGEKLCPASKSLWSSKPSGLVRPPESGWPMQLVWAHIGPRVLTSESMQFMLFCASWPNAMAVRSEFLTLPEAGIDNGDSLQAVVMA